MLEVYLGTIILWPLSWAPVDWAFCNGQLLQINQYNALFSLLSTQYGGDGVNTFGLPDLRSRVPIGVYQPGNSQTPFTLTPGDLADTGGCENSTLPLHTHGASVNGSNITGNIMVSSQPATAQTATANSSIAAPGTNARPSVPVLGFNNSTPDTVISGLNITGGIASSITIGNSGVSGNYTNLQPFLGLNYIICTAGLYPQRP